MTVREQVALKLKELENQGGGILTAEAVVEEAKRKTSVLHDFFTWDIKEAAYAHWLEQARSLIRSVRVEIITTTRIIKAVGYVRDPASEPKDQGYISVERLRDDADLSREAVAYEFARAAAALTRARDLAVALGMSDEVDKLIDGVNSLRQPLLMPPGASPQ